MPSNVIQFPNRYRSTHSRQSAVPYPSTAAVYCEDSVLLIDPVDRVVEQLLSVEPEEEPSPAIFALNRCVYVDLADCTPDRTLLMFDADTAIEWATALLKAAKQIKGDIP